MPVAVSRMFFRALNRIKNWQHLPVGVAAQSVQRSAFPSAYADQEQPALGLVTFLETKYDPGSYSIDTITGSGLGDGSSTGPGKIVLSVEHYVLTAGFGQCSSHWVNCHAGLDFAAPTGTPVHAVMGGKIIWTGWAAPTGT